MAGLIRSVAQWHGLSPKAVADGSPAQIYNCVLDARKDILFMADVLRDAHKTICVMHDRKILNYSEWGRIKGMIEDII